MLLPRTKLRSKKRRGEQKQDKNKVKTGRRLWRLRWLRRLRKRREAEEGVARRR